MQLDFTARNRTAQANYSTSLIEAKRLKYVQSQTEQNIEAQVRNALQSIQTARQRITAAEASERAAKENPANSSPCFLGGLCEAHYFRSTGGQPNDLLRNVAVDQDVPGIVQALQRFAVTRGIHLALRLQVEQGERLPRLPDQDFQQCERAGGRGLLIKPGALGGFHERSKCSRPGLEVRHRLDPIKRP